MADFDAARFKREERAGYNLIAARYEAGSVLRAGLNTALLDAADLKPGQWVLDLASGPGVLARDAVTHILKEDFLLGVRGGFAVASDIAELSLQEGRSRAAGDGCGGLAFVAADAERLCFADHSFDRVLCGLGLMFFPDVPRALAEMRRVLKPDGRIVFSVWAAAERTPLVACALQCIRRILPPPKVERLSPFRFAEPALLQQTLEQAGLTGVAVHPYTLNCAFESSADYWQAFRDLAGGAATGLSRLPVEILERLGREVAQELAPWRQGEGYRVESGALIATASRQG